MERQQRVQHRQRPVGDAERLLGLGERAKQPPFVHDGFGCARSSREISRSLAWLATMASDSDRRPKGVVGCVCMILCLVQAKEIRSPKRRRTLDSDSRKWFSLKVAKEQRRLPGRVVSGAFFFCGLTS